MIIPFKVIQRNLLENSETNGDKKAVKITLASDEISPKDSKSGKYLNEYYGGARLEILLPVSEYENYPLGSIHELT